MRYALYFPEDGKFSVLMTLKEAKAMLKVFTTASLIDGRTGEVLL